MTRAQLTWILAIPLWLAASLGVLRLGDLGVDAGSCALDGPWG
jgi:hypothetical protein